MWLGDTHSEAWDEMCPDASAQKKQHKMGNNCVKKHKAKTNRTHPPQQQQQQKTCLNDMDVRANYSQSQPDNQTIQQAFHVSIYMNRTIPLATNITISFTILSVCFHFSKLAYVLCKFSPHQITTTQTPLSQPHPPNS